LAYSSGVDSELESQAAPHVRPTSEVSWVRMRYIWNVYEFTSGGRGLK